MATRISSLLLLVPLAACSGSQTREEPHTTAYAAPPTSVPTPDRVETRVGSLSFFDGLPSDDTVRAVYDNLDFQRAVRAFLDTLPGASMQAIKTGMDEAGALPNYTVLLTESRLDARASFLTANSESVYAFAWLSLKGGPIAVSTPPGVSGFFSDAWQRHLGDVGQAGPDRGKGGLYVIAPPGYTGYVPQTKYAIRSRTFGVLAVFVAPMVRGNTKWAVRTLKERLRIYPLKEAKRPPPNQFVDISGRPMSTIHANDATFYESIHALVQEEPVASQDSEVLGVLAAIGIEKDKRFEPDARMRAILDEAALVGSATARSLLFRNRAEMALFPGSYWEVLPRAEAPSEHGGAVRLDARIAFHYYALEPSTSPATGVGGLERVVAFRDGEGRWLDGANTYSLTLPPNIPSASWSVVAYDNQTRSMLQTDQRFPSLSNERRVPMDEDGSITLYFGPKPPRGKKASWIQTIPGKGYSVVLRFDRPREPWFDGSWRPGDLERLPANSSAPLRRKRPRMATDASDLIAMPERASTRLGTLELVDGVPTQRTADLLYRNLDFMRGVEAFLSMLPGASLVAMRRGLREAGVDGNGAIGIFDRGVDAHSLVLTQDADRAYLATWLDLDAGATIVETPSGGHGSVDDFLFRNVAPLGGGGPDRGKGGLFLFVPERYEGQLSERYFAFRSPTYGNLLTWGGIPREDDWVGAVERIRNQLQVYPFDVDVEELLEGEAEEETTRFISLSGTTIHTVHASDVGFYEEIAELVREEPASAFSAELLGLLASIGIEKDDAFAPDQSQRVLLTEAARVGSATARALVFRPRDPSASLYEDSGWYAIGARGNRDLVRHGARLLDARTARFFLTTGPSRAAGRAYCASDAEGRYLDGARSYRLVLPKATPATDGWSIVVYDPQTRSMLQTPRSSRPTTGSRRGAIAEADGTTEIFFGPKPPEGRSTNWIQTVPGKAWFAALWLYGPLEPWFDRSWRPGEIERID